MKLPLVTLATLAALSAPFLAGNARADEPVAATAVEASAPATLPPVAPSTVSEWYGWQTIVSDAATVATTAALAAASGSNGTVGTFAGINGVAGYGAAPSFIHLAHGRPWVALADLGIRAGAVALGAFIGLATASSHTCGREERGCGIEQLVGMGTGAIVGMVSASILDATALSWGRKAPPKLADEQTASFTIAPQLLLTKDQAGLGVHGTF